MMMPEEPFPMLLNIPGILLLPRDYSMLHAQGNKTMNPVHCLVKSLIMLLLIKSIV